MSRSTAEKATWEKVQQRRLARSYLGSAHPQDIVKARQALREWRKGFDAIGADADADADAKAMQELNCNASGGGAMEQS